MPLLRFFFRNWAALKTDILRPSQPADISFNSLWVERGNEKSLLCQLFLLLLTKYISRYDIGGLSTFQIDIHIFWDILKLLGMYYFCKIHEKFFHWKWIVVVVVLNKKKNSIFDHICCAKVHWKSKQKVFFEVTRLFNIDGVLFWSIEKQLSVLDTSKRV